MAQDRTPKFLAERLAARAEDFVPLLLPNGKLIGDEWAVGSVAGDAGDSLKIKVRGDRAGLYKDFASDARGGDLLDLIVAVRGGTLRDAMKEACTFLDLGAPDFASKPKRQTYTLPAKPATAQGLSTATAVATWFAARGIGIDVLRSFKIFADRDDTAIFPYMRDGQILHYKFRSVTEKKFWASKDTEKLLFGWQALKPQVRSVILTEGELDCLAMAEYGFQALSIPFGAGSGGKQDWIDNEWENLERFDTIYLAMDGDAAGEIATQDLVERLGRHRCKVIKLPHKDANECLMRGVSKDTMLLAIRESRTLDPKELRNAREFTQQIKERFYPPSKAARGFVMPWLKVADDFFFEWGCTTIVAGYAGHGKALALDTPVPTPSGWTTMGELDVGDTVFDAGGNHAKVVATTEVMNGRPCFSVKFSDGAQITADAEHLWATRAVRVFKGRRRGGSKGGYGREPTASLRTTQEVAASLLEPSRVAAMHAIDTCGPLANETASLPLDPYLLGVWLGDGHSNNNYVTMMPEDAEVCLADTGATLVPSSIKQDTRARTFLVPHTRPTLRSLGVLGNKHIPAQYLRASKEQRLELLRGLMDTDGHTTAGGRCEFTSVVEHMALQVLELSISLGLRARLVRGRAACNGKDTGPKFRITFTPWFSVFRLPRKARHTNFKARLRSGSRYVVACDSIASVPVRCIQVSSPDGLFLAGREMIPTHNSEIVGQIALDAIRQNVRICAASLEFRSSKWLQRLVRQATGNSQPPHSLIDKAVDWIGDSLWAFDVYGSAKADRILEVFAYAHRRYNVKFFIIDNFSKLGIPDDDLAEQKRVISNITEFAVLHNVHVVLVNHLRKVEDDYASANKLSVKGSGAIVDLADNVVMVWRNVPKESKTRSAEWFKLDDVKRADILRAPDTVMTWVKHRNGDSDPRLPLYFNRATHTWTEGQGEPPHIYVTE